jgi:shikimate kinase
MNLFLIGYRCTGKSTVGERLAARISWAFIDTDAEVVAATGAPIADLVAREGWPAFRRAESAVIDRLCRRQRQVVATGGGVVLDGENVRKMRGAGRVIWLTASPETIRHRMLADDASPGQRPPLTDSDLDAEIRETLTRRRDRYAAAADMTVDTDSNGSDAVAEAIIRRLQGDPGSALFGG